MFYFPSPLNVVKKLIEAANKLNFAKHIISSPYVIISPEHSFLLIDHICPSGELKMPIHQLAPDVAAKIAAGEVVERPASVVKELIENSIDAGAMQIRVDLMNGGLQLIRVIDNGCGIPAEELPLALARHATSKVAQIDDLEHIRSLGFRGEALASIAAVADVVLLSRAKEAAQGAQISATNGQISEVTTAASPVGTTLVVRNLFSAVPARLKFLKSRNTEISHCLHLLQQYALAYPEIRFSVFSEGRQIFATPGDRQLSSVLIEIYGLQVAEQMVPITSDNSNDITRPVVSGYVSQPTCYKSTRQHLSFFVNRRWVLSRMLSYAVEEAYHSLLLSGRHPIAIVNISLDPTLIDVNVHPAKTEIRFLKERLVFATVMRAVRQAVLEEPKVPEWRHIGATSNAQFIAPNTAPLAVASNITSGIASSAVPPDTTPDHEEEHDDETDIMDQDVADGEPAATLLPQDNPWLTVTEEETGTKPPLSSRLWQSHIRHQGNNEPSPSIVVAPLVGARGGVDARGGVGAGEGITPQQSRRIPPLRVLGQLLQSYIVAEGPEGLYLVDQHAAHERILLERMLAALRAKTPISQLLLTPLRFELAPRELEAIEEHLQQLEQIGFNLEIQDSSLVARAVPNVLVKQMTARSLHDLLADLTAPENPGHSETWEEHALANVACKAAIKGNYFLTVNEMREMIEQLEQTSAPYSCCHGRPTMVHFSLSALEREFGRR
jgi:DNA mismatch repair protein MutL